MTIKNVSLVFIDLYGLITNDKVSKSDPVVGNYSETGISAGATIDLLLYNTPARIYECFELWRRIISAEIAVLCGVTVQNPADSLKHFQTFGMQCFLDTEAVLPVPVLDPFIWGNSEFDASKIITDTIAGNTDDYTNPALQTAIMIKFSVTSGNKKLTGITAPTVGRWKILIVYNESGGHRKLKLKSNDNGSAAANQFQLHKDIDLHPEQSISLFYDQSISRWRSWSQSIK